MDVPVTDPLTPELIEALTQECYDNFDQYSNRWPDPIRKWPSGQVLEWEAQGVYIKDIRGVTYIDFLGGYGIFTLGHRHPELVAAAKAQLDRMGLHSQKLLNPLCYEAARRLAAVSPGNLKRTFFTNSGTESVEGALKLARLYTKRTKFVSTIRSFHGKTMGSLSVTGREIFQNPVKPLLPCTFVPYGDADALIRVLDDQTAAVILEPIQGEGGVNIPPDDFWPRVRQATRELGILLIADEVQTGLGRTGRMWGVDHWGIVPDIMCIAKALSGGLIPVGAFHTTDEIWKAFHPLPLFQTSTFGSNPLAMTVAAKTIEITVRDGLPERGHETGVYLIGEIEKLQREIPGRLAAVRGRGCLLGLEATTEQVGIDLAEELFRRKVLVAHTLNNPRVIRMEPPLNVERSVVDTVLGHLAEAMRAVVPHPGAPDIA